MAVRRHAIPKIRKRAVAARSGLEVSQAAPRRKIKSAAPRCTTVAIGDSSRLRNSNFVTQMDLMFTTARKLAAPWFGVDRSQCPTNPFAYVKLEESGRVAQLAEQCPFNSLLFTSYLADSIT